MATDEIVQTIERLAGAFEDLTMRGLRSAGPKDLAVLRAMREEFERIGAGHLAGRVGAVIDAIDRNDRSAAIALLEAQGSLRVFERILTLEIAAALLRNAAAEQDDTDSEAEEEP
jgi:hypothetical protein